MSALATSARVDFARCVMCGMWDFCWRGQCAECFGAAHMTIERRTWRQELRRDWVLRYEPWLAARWAEAANPLLWPAPMALLALVALVGRELWRGL